MNYDSDQEIIKNTVIEGGKWSFYEGGQLIAQADSPSEPSRGVLEQWTAAVRSRTKPELTTADADERNARRNSKRMEKKESGIIDVSGNPLHPDVVGMDNPSLPSMAEHSTAEGDTDPDAFIEKKIAAAEARAKALYSKRREVQAVLTEIEAEQEIVVKERATWEKMKGIINE